jgi:hypothetical protein
MDKFNLKQEIRVFGFQVSNCPEGIGEAFNDLVDRVGGGFRRQYYGISQMKDGCCIYRAAAEATFEGEGRQFGLEEFEIEKGEYLAVIIRDWRKKTESIKDVYHEMVRDNRVDCTKPFIEWYKDDDEMICMAPLQPANNVNATT